jgi:hypothetical protein
MTLPGRPFSCLMVGAPILPLLFTVRTLSLPLPLPHWIATPGTAPMRQTSVESIAHTEANCSLSLHQVPRLTKKERSSRVGEPLLCLRRRGRYGDVITPVAAGVP